MPARSPTRASARTTRTATARSRRSGVSRSRTKATGATKTKRSAVPARRLPPIPDSELSAAQRALLAEITASRGHNYAQEGPFGVFLHAPVFGDLAQKLGAHCRYHTALAPRLSEFVILVTARHWRAQYEWYAHAALAEQAGVKPQTIADLRAGRTPTRAPADERALYAFVTELYRTRRVSDATYRTVQRRLGDAAVVELVGILGYYALVAMALNVFRMPLPEGASPAFRE